MALNPKLKVEILNLKAGATSWTDVTTVTKRAVGSGGMLGPQSPNPIPGQCDIVLRNSSGSYTPGANTIVEPGNIVRVLCKSLLGNCLRNTHTGLSSVFSSFQQVKSLSLFIGQVFTLTWYARCPWDSKWNTDSVYIQTSSEVGSTSNYTYTNKWKQYSLTFTATANATTIAPVFSPDLTRNQPYQYTEYKGISLTRAGIEILTNGSFASGLTGWTIFDSVPGSGSFSNAAVDDTYSEFYGFIEDIDPIVLYPVSAAEVTLKCGDFVNRLALSSMAAPIQRNQTADQLLQTALEYVYENPKATWKALCRQKLPRRWYRFTETTGTTAADSGLDNLPATHVNSPTLGVATMLTNGDTDPAATYNGTTQYSSVPTIDISNRSWSFTTLINRDHTGGANQAIIGFYNAGQHMSIWAYDSGEWGIGFPDLTAGYSSTTPDTSLSNAVNHFICFTYDYPSRTGRFYMDGVLKATKSPIAPYTIANPVIQIGANGNSATYFKGNLDEPQIWDYCLTDTEVSDLYTATQFSAELQKRWLPGVLIETGTQTFSVSFDGYDATKTSIADVLADCATSEAGRWYFDRDGTLRFRNRYWAQLWRNRLNSPAYTGGETYRNLILTSGVGGTAYNPIPIYAGSKVVNRVKVSYRPRTTNSGAIVAVGQIPSIVTVKPLQSGSYGKSDAVPGEETITIHFRDSSNNPCAATNIQLPLVYYNSASPATPYDVRVVGDVADETNGTDYTPGSVLGGYFQLQILNINASEATIRLRNYALGPLYVTKLQLRGYTITSFDPVIKEAIDKTSRLQVGERVMSKFLPFCSDGNFAQALAEYYLLRFSTPFMEYGFEFENVNSIGGVDLLGVEMGDTIGIDSVSGTAHTVAAYTFDLTPDEGKLFFQGNRADTQIFASYDTDYTLYDSFTVYGL